MLKSLALVAVVLQSLGFSYEQAGRTRANIYFALDMLSMSVVAL